MSSSVQVALSPELYMLQLRAMQDEITKRDREIQRLKDQLEYERNLREKLEERFGKLPEERTERKTRKRRNVALDDNTYSDFKSDGKRKAHAADSIRSYDDFYAIQQYWQRTDSRLGNVDNRRKSWFANLRPFVSEIQSLDRPRRENNQAENMYLRAKNRETEQLSCNRVCKIRSKRLFGVNQMQI